jgi:VWFA-related protein
MTESDWCVYHGDARGITRRTALAHTLVSLPFARLLVQSPQDQATFSTAVRVVNLFATVRDKRDQIVRDLTRDDFELEEDGRPQSIRYFSQQSNLPLTLGLLIDTSMSERRRLGEERQASLKFLEQVLRPDRDRAFLIHFDHEVELLQDVTSSRERLEKALASLDTSDAGGRQQRSGGGRYGGRGGGGRPGAGHFGGGTALLDAVFLACDEVMKEQQGRKALILLTDGEDRGSKTSLPDAITSAQRASTLAYSVRIADEHFKDSGFGGPGMRRGSWGGPGGGRGRLPQSGAVDGKKVLQDLSKQTGASFFEVSSKKPAEKIFSEIEDELRNQYSLGYTPDRPEASSPGFRKIHLVTKQKNYTVQTRDGYYADTMKPSS